MPPIRVTAGTKVAPPPKAPAAKPTPAPAPKYNVPAAPVRGPKTVSNYAPPGKSATAAPTATHGPRMVSNYHAPKVTKAATKKSSGTSLLGVITAPGDITSGITHALSGVGHELGHIGSSALKDAYHLPGNMLQGAETVGKAAATDFMNALEHGHGTMVGGPTSSGGFFNDTNLGRIAHSAWQTSAVHDIVHGNIKGAVDKFTAHPLYTALDFAGGAGALGRVAGAAARTGKLGEKVAEAASLTREPHVLAPGLQPIVRHYSPNLLKKGAQVVVDHNPRLQAAVRAATGNTTTRLLRKQEDYGRTMSENLRHGALADTADRLHANKPKGSAAHVLPYAVQGVARLGEHGQFLDDLQRLAEQLDREHAAGYLTKTMKEANRRHANNIREFLTHPDVAAVAHAAEQHAGLQHAIDQEKVRLGLLDPEEARMRRLMPYVAAGHLPGARIANKAEPTIRAAAWRDANKEVKTLSKHLDQTKLSNAKLIGTDPRDPELRQLTARRLAAAQDALKDAKEHRKAYKDYRNEKVDGVVSDTTVPLRKGKYAVRKVSAQEIEDHMRASGVNPDHIAYVNLSAPTRTLGSIARRGLSRGDSKGARATMEGLTSGQWEPGYGALSHSALSGVNSIANAKTFDDFISRAAAKDASGAPQLYKAGQAEQAAADLSKRYGVQMTPVAAHSATLRAGAEGKVARLQSRVSPLDGEGKYLKPADAPKGARFALVPAESADRYLAHLKADQAGHGAVAAFNRQFRNTVLPFSTKWFAGNTIEAGLRSALVGAGPRDAKLVDKVIAAAGDEGAPRIEALMNGLHFGMAHRQNMDAIGAGGMLDAPNHELLHAIRNSPGIRQASDFYTKQIVQRVFAFNRRIEQYAEKAALGAHMHRQMREFGATWLQAAQHEEQWMQKLAEGYSDPAMAMDAARFIHETLGRYDSFSPKMRRLIATWAPFLPWYRNAVRFVYHTMPVKHPLTSAILLHAQQAVQPAWDKQGKAVPHGTFAGLPEGSLLSALQTGPSSYLDLGRYTPAGAFTDGPLNAGMGAIAPQVQGIYRALSGQDPFGRALRDPHGKAVTDDAQRGLLALNQALEEILGPAYMMHRLFQEHGSTPYQTDTLWNTQIKPNTHHGFPGVAGGAERVLDPFFPTYLARNTASGGSSKGLGQEVGIGSDGGGLGQQVGLK